MRDCSVADSGLSSSTSGVAISQSGAADAGAAVPSARPRSRLAYGLTPHRLLGGDRVAGVEFTVTGSTETATLQAGLVLTSIGYHGKAIPDLPFDDGVVPNERGRVTFTQVWDAVTRKFPNSLTPDSLSIREALEKYARKSGKDQWMLREEIRLRLTSHPEIIAILALSLIHISEPTRPY